MTFRLLSLMIQTVMFVVLARRFDAGVLAPWIVATTLLQSTSVFTDCGMTVAVPVALRDESPTTAGRAFRTGLLVVLVGALINLAGALLISMIFGFDWQPMIVWLAPWLIAQRVAGLTNVLFNVKRRLVTASAAELAGRALALLCVVILPPRLTLMSAALATQFLGTIVLLFWEGKPFRRVVVVGEHPKDLEVGQRRSRCGWRWGCSGQNGSTDSCVGGRS